jgi:hypothetical protein
MIGRLYPYEKTKPIVIDDEQHCVNFTIRRAPTPVYFLPEQMKEVRSYLSKHAGVAKKSTRTKTKTAAESTGKKAAKQETKSETKAD